MANPTAAKGTFPYPHRAVAQVWWGDLPQVEESIADLERINRARNLTDAESGRLENLIRKQARLVA